MLYIVDSNECDSCSKDCIEGLCINVNGEQLCKCYDGYTNANNMSSSACKDIDECNFVDCGGGYCVNSVGSFDCICNAGFFNIWNKTDSPCREFELLTKFSFFQKLRN